MNVYDLDILLKFSVSTPVHIPDLVYDNLVYN